MSDFNFAKLKETKPEAILAHLITERFTKTNSRFKAALDKGDIKEDKTFKSYELYQYPFLKPINPLLLASAISISIIRQNDFQSFLSDYVQGLSLNSLEESLIKVPSFNSEEELNTFLNLEDQFIDVFRMLALKRIVFDLVGVQFSSKSTGLRVQSIVDEKKRLSLVSLAVSEFWEYVKAENIPYEWRFDKFDIMFHCWLEANPLYYRFSHIAQQYVLYEYSYDKNDEICNNLNYYENNSKSILYEINILLKSNIKKEGKILEINKRKLSQINAARLEKRAIRFYKWSPAEIDAFRIEEKAAILLGLREQGPQVELTQISFGIATGKGLFGDFF